MRQYRRKKVRAQPLRRFWRLTEGGFLTAHYSSRNCEAIFLPGVFSGWETAAPFGYGVRRGAK
jgi:hypothetical protein